MADNTEEVSTATDTATAQQSDSVENDSKNENLVSGSEGEVGTAVDSSAKTSSESSVPSSAATPSSQPPVSNCVFCRIISKQLPSEIVHEDADYVCFIDRSPASTHHYLIVPRQHIRDARSLTVDQLPIIDKMAEVGKQVLAERGGNLDNVRMGFHWPPFLMVRHLHMHVISPASQMGWLHRNIVFRNDSFAFTSPTATIDYLRKSLNK